jgi:hypothetical protein
VTELVVLARRADVNSRWIDDDTDWAATHAYALGDRVAGTPRNGHVYVVTVAGTSGASAPVFPTTSGHDRDRWGGDVAGGRRLVGADLRPQLRGGGGLALEGGHRRRAVRLLDQRRARQQSFARSAKHAHCLAMMQAYQAKVLSSPRIRSSVPVRTLPAIPVPYDDQVVA